MTTPGLLTTGQAAQRLGCSPQTVRRLCARGLLRTRRLTELSPRQILAADVERLLARAAQGDRS